MSFGERMRKRREAGGLTRVELARRASVPDWSWAVNPGNMSTGQIPPKSALGGLGG